MIRSITSWLTANGIPDIHGAWLAYVIFALAILVVSVAANFVAKSMILRAVRYFIQRSKNQWDDILFEGKVFDRLSHLAPALILYLAALIAFEDAHDHYWAVLLTRGAIVYMIIAGTHALEAFLSACGAIYGQFPVARERPIKGYIQAVKLIIMLCAIILVIATITDKSPVIFFSGLGAITAILLLVFKDAILGFVAGIQLSVNNMVRPGDWISMPKYGADGDVIDVSLTTVKVQNWDKTITTIPIYSLISDSFTNWRGMTEAGGRRIKRSILLDLTSVHFLSGEEIAHLETFRLLKPYLDEKRAELRAANEADGLFDGNDHNSRRLTNLGTFRAYMEFYVRSMDQIHPEMTFLVRQLNPTPQGLPMEIYVFSRDIRWAYYEKLQADIFDHLLAILPHFGLRVFQNPSSGDLRGLVTAVAGGLAAGSATQGT